MSNYETQLEAMGTALLLIDKLPPGMIWGLEVTNDDDATSPTVLNIFIEQSGWSSLAELLHLGRSTDRSTHDRGEQFTSYRKGTLLVSLIEQEEKNV